MYESINSILSYKGILWVLYWGLFQTLSYVLFLLKIANWHPPFAFFHWINTLISLKMYKMVLIFIS